jgi:dipicolinate synthase subunit A
MQPNLRGVKVAVMGGDARELIVVEELASLGACVIVLGLPVKSRPGTVVIQDPEEGLSEIQALVLPLPGIDEKGFLYSPLAERPLTLTGGWLARIPPNIPVFVGLAKPTLVQIASQKNLRLIELMKLNEVAILNSIPTAEGALQMAMEMLPITIHGCTALVLGFGRTGATLSRLLGAMGARTMVAARRPEYLARITEMNLIPIPFHELDEALDDADLIFNTVPVQVLSEKMLRKVAPETVIIDLASAPGGTDFRAAKVLGINAVLAPGLPGKVAPKTAGLILARVITRLLLEEMGR